tara:strand:- start:1347 stop:1583 length:237 start_codon:yes stop_codon:yes gene_type:complete
MAKTKSVSSEELKELQGLQGALTQLKMRLGDIELHRQDTLRKVEELRVATATTEQKLIDKYGEDSVINVQTGEITTKE